MGTQSIELLNRETKRTFYEDKMIEEGKNYLLFKHYHLGEPTDVQKLIHIGNLHRGYSSENCNVQTFIKEQLEPDHDYTKIENTRMCEEFDICYKQ